jgi:multicomponent Na+:H+ antiporter subunit E
MTTWRKWAVVRIILTTLYLFPGWLLFTGSVEPLSMAAGVGFSFLIALGTYSLFIDSSEASIKSLLPRLPLFIIYLLLVIVKMYISSFQVVWKIIRGRYNPRIVHFRTRLSSDIARAVLANSITITPGTITVDMRDDHLIVHWLDAPTTHSRYAGILIKDKMERLLQKVWV